MREAELIAVGAGGVRLAVRDFASTSPDAPGLLLHHGLASSSHIWDLMLPRLMRRFKVVAFDARGHGRSGKPTSGYGFETVVADALAVARATRLHRPVMVGHSWGAMVALELAARHPRVLSGAVLIDGGIASLGASMDWKTAKQQLAPPQLRGMPVDEFLGFVRGMLEETLSFTPEVEAIVLSVMRVGRDRTIRANLSRANHFRILRAIWEQDPTALHARLRVPTLAILAHETGDDPTWTRAKRDAAAGLQATRNDGLLHVTWMKGVHDLPLQHPDALARRILRFADEVVR
ncbi:MAG: alpha/beta hydrolase [Actinomycetota bacterium]|nr:alpha/beta hydrolase [Actinomycetota bacterium]